MFKVQLSRRVLYNSSFKEPTQDELVLISNTQLE